MVFSTATLPFAGGAGAFVRALAVFRRLNLPIIAALAALLVSAALAPSPALAATATVSCSDMVMTVLNVRSEMPASYIDMNKGTCLQQPVTTAAPTIDSGFGLQGYTESPASEPYTVLQILPGAIIGGKGRRFEKGNPVRCTGDGCVNPNRYDYAFCNPTNGSCSVSASVDVDGEPATISGFVPSGQYRITNISVSYEPSSLPPPPNAGPVFSGVPSNISVGTDTGLPTAIVSFTPPTAIDAVDGPVTPILTVGLPSGSAFPLGVTTVTYSATDKSNNSNTASFTVTVTDDEKPVIAPISDISVGTDSGLTTASVSFSTTVSDNVGKAGDFTLTYKVGGMTVQSGDAFPIGTTTVTVSANADAAGNTPDPISFDITVGDKEGPSFLSFPSDVVQNIDYPQATAVMVWSDPLATDNVGPVSVTRTAGPASGTAFPIGVTTVTYKAEDTAGNSTTRSFTVTVLRKEPGSVTFIVNSAAERRFAFSSAESVLNLSVDTVAGTGRAGPIAIRPGSYGFTFSGPADVGLASASCTEGGTIDLAGKRGEVDIRSNASVTCTISAYDSVRETVAQVTAMATVRSQLILATGPNIGRRLDRLNGTPGGGSIGGFGMAFADPNLPLSFRMSGNGGSFALSLADVEAAGNGATDAAAALSDAGLAADPGTRLQPVDAWIEGSFARFDASGGSGDFGILHAGLDYLVTPDLLVGIGGQLDWIGMNASGGTGRVDGLGFMVGPYLTANLAEGLYFDARAAWGYSSNRINPFGTYVDTAIGQRGLVTAALGGKIDLGPLEMRPEARLSWYREVIGGYVDSLSVAIPQVTVDTGNLEFGPTFRLPNVGADGTSLTPFASLTGIWTFAQTGKATGGSGQPGIDTAALRASVEAGIDLATAGGFSLSASAFYDGLGTSTYSAAGGNLAVGQKF